jgi:protein-tyrosine kinase
MSIIEKAVGKLNAPAGKKVPSERFRDEDLVEKTPEALLEGYAPDHEQGPADQAQQRDNDPRLPAAAESSLELAAAVSSPAASPETRNVSESANKLVLDFDYLSSRGFISPHLPRSAVADEFRGIKRPLLRNIAHDRMTEEYLNLIMVTSAMQGDGKTFCSINLALSIAMEQDKTVLFVDADVLKGSAGRLLGVKRGTPGLIDLLNDPGLDPGEVIQATNLPKLKVLPAGKPHDHATELLASETMRDLMVELATRYEDRVLVFDSPPLLLTTESGVLASAMGQIVFVVAAEVTPQPAVTSALQRISEDKSVGVVLNRASARRRGLLGIGIDYSYGYGYGYGYSRDGEESEESDEGVIASKSEAR